MTPKWGNSLEEPALSVDPPLPRPPPPPLPPAGSFIYKPPAPWTSQSFPDRRVMEPTIHSSLELSDAIAWHCACKQYFKGPPRMLRPNAFGTLVQDMGQKMQPRSAQKRCTETVHNHNCGSYFDALLSLGVSPPPLGPPPVAPRAKKLDFKRSGQLLGEPRGGPKPTKMRPWGSPGGDFGRKGGI